MDVCHAPQFYDGSYPQVLNTCDMSAETRGVWSTEYRVRWPCQDSDVSDCVRDYHSDVCPLGWRRSGNDCVAPRSYVGCHFCSADPATGARGNLHMEHISLAPLDL